MTEIKKYSTLNLPDGSSPGSGISIVNDIYNPILINSIKHKCSTFSFSATSLVELTSGLEGFIENGGSMQLVFGQVISSKEEKSIFIGTKKREQGQYMQQLCMAQLKTLIKNKDTYNGDLPYKLGLLTSLIGSGKLEIRFCLSTKSHFIQHSKIFIFNGLDDEEIMWEGSANSSMSGLTGNLESVSLYKSWDDLSGYTRHAQRLDNAFNSIWENKLEEWKTVKVPSEFYKEYSKTFPYQKHKKPTNLPETGSSESFPDENDEDNNKNLISWNDLFDHQRDVITDWIAKDMQGIVEHATGSGKSWTGIFAIKKFFEKGGSNALIVVPGDILMEQWRKDLFQLIPEASIDYVGGKIGKGWQKRVRSMSKPIAGKKRVIIATYDSACSDDLVNKIDDGEHLMLLADEAHKIGAPTFQKILQIESGARMALSATIQRYGDEDGTAKIFEYFKNDLEPKFGLKEAIDGGYLVRYNYTSTPVKLTPDESEEWINLSKKIGQIYARLKSSPKEMKNKLKNQFNTLCRERALIHKKASKKVSKALSIIQENYNPVEEQRWLVYCQDTVQLESLGLELSNKNITWTKYYSSLKKEQLKSTKDRFEKLGGLLLSIGCLDEGVDIPAADFALIIASSSNPRQYIQRRGRVLRKDKLNPGKLANIFDLCILPSSNYDGDKQFAPMVVAEISRIREFAEHSNNSNFTLNFIEDKKIDYGIASDMHLNNALIDTEDDEG